MPVKWSAKQVREYKAYHAMQNEYLRREKRYRSKLRKLKNREKHPGNVDLLTAEQHYELAVGESDMFHRATLEFEIPVAL